MPIVFEKCGQNIELDRPTGRIVPSRRRGSESGPVGTFPWMVSIGEVDDKGNWQHICGGSLVRKDFVLTAAHCLPYSGYHKPHKKLYDQFKCPSIG